MGLDLEVAAGFDALETVGGLGAEVGGEALLVRVLGVEDALLD